MEHNYSNPHVAPPPASLPHPMQYQRSPQSQYPMPDSEPRPLFGSGQQQPYPHPQQLPYPQPHYDHGMPYGQPQSPQSPHYPPPQTVQLPPMSTAVPQHYNVPYTMDTTGQVPPPGMRPRLTTSIFEEEGSLCFQVDVNGICVARREDNHMINGTKLLNVAQMTRGRRDGILKAEKQKAVVKIGPMHLKGVWIPFERALALANQEKITEQLYPLFVHQIDSLLYHPANAARQIPPPGAYPEEQKMSPVQVPEGDDRRPRL